MRTKEGMIRPKQDQTPTQQTSNSAAIWWPSVAHDRISWAPRALRSFTCPAVPPGIHLASLFTRICKLLAFLNRYFMTLVSPASWVLHRTSIVLWSQDSTRPLSLESFIPAKPVSHEWHSQVLLPLRRDLFPALGGTAAAVAVNWLRKQLPQPVSFPSRKPSALWV